MNDQYIFNFLGNFEDRERRLLEKYFTYTHKITESGFTSIIKIEYLNIKNYFLFLSGKLMFSTYCFYIT